jgi:hypothetical protein
MQREVKPATKRLVLKIWLPKLLGIRMKSCRQLDDRLSLLVLNTDTPARQTEESTDATVFYTDYVLYIVPDTETYIVLVFRYNKQPAINRWLFSFKRFIRNH